MSNITSTSISEIRRTATVKADAPAASIHGMPDYKPSVFEKVIETTRRSGFISHSAWKGLY